ncbi:MAG TPA: LuxR C-terminal-related transcriptional regulator [Candidatus Limnocylindrales bacterium]|nr:LuxR C-terminal-related transcriptional regulator [Candidatus Limnocylindrales bacterium]
MGTSEPGGSPTSADRGQDRSSGPAAQVARDQARLRASQAAVASDVIEFQLARQRVGLASLESVEPLSPREREVLALLAAGRTDGEIADELFISKKTASVHVANIKAKLGASSRVEIALMAARLGLAEEGATAPPEEPPAPPARGVVVCPFKGLASYEAVDARYFFGREPVVAALVAKLVGAGMLGLVGPSGSGKSSVLRAGLLPALADGVLPGSDRWTVGTLRPGATPSAELRAAIAAALRRAGLDPPESGTVSDALDRLPVGVRLVVVADQFEELFTVCADEEERAAFVAELVRLSRDADGRAVVIVAIRADQYGRCAAYRDLAENLAANHLLIGSMTAEELGRAVELPARAAGLRVEPQLTAALVSAVVGEPGGLPLLSTTLLELWQRRDGRTMRLEAYERIGGVSGAVARLAESAHERLTEDQRPIARAVVLRLVAVGDDGTLGRRPIAPDTIDARSDPDVERVLTILTESRLVTLDEGRLEIAHEALLREWPRLRRWIEDDAGNRHVREHLARAAADWDRGGRSPAELYRGSRLAAAVDWWADHDREATAVERAFLDASRAEADREITTARRANRRLRALLGAAGALLVVALVAAGFAAAQERRAQDEAARAARAARLAQEEADRADRSASVARSRELVASAIASLDEDPTLSKLLALSAASLEDPPLEAISVLHQAFGADRVVGRRDWPEGTFGWLWFDPDPRGRQAVVTAEPYVNPNQRIEVIDLGTGETRWTWEVDNPGLGVGMGHFTADGTRIVAGVHRDIGSVLEGASASADLGVHVWDATTWDRVAFWGVEGCGAIVIGAAESRVLLATSPPGDCFDGPPLSVSLEVLDLETGRRGVLAPSIVEFQAAITPDGRYVAYDEVGTAAAASVSIVWDSVTGEKVEIDPSTIPGQEHGWVRDISADGRFLLYGDFPVQVLDLRSDHAPVDLVTDDTGFVPRAEFDRSGERVYGVGRDGELRVWLAETGEELLAIADVATSRVAPTTDGRVIASRGDQSTLLVLDIGVRGERGAVDARAVGDFWPEQNSGCFVLAAGLFVAGAHAAFLDTCGAGFGEATTQVVNIEALDLAYSLRGAAGNEIAVSPDGRHFVRQEAEETIFGSLAIRSLADGGLVRLLDGLCQYDNAAPLPYENVGDCRRFPETPFPIWPWQLRWSPDGSMIAAADQSNSWFVAVWDAETGELLSPARTELLSADRLAKLAPNPTTEELASAELVAWDVIFSPDSRSLLVSYDGGAEGDGAIVDVVSLETWQVVKTVTVKGILDLDFVGYSPDGSRLIAASELRARPGGLYWLDATTLEPVLPPIRRAHEASMKSIALSPDGSLIATGASDGSIRIWNAVTTNLVHEITLGAVEVQGVAFIDNETLAVTPRDSGSLLLYTLDPQELLRIARGSLTRGFTEVECARYGFGDACPALEELRGG